MGHVMGHFSPLWVILANSMFS